MKQKSTKLGIIFQRNFTVFWIALFGFALADALFTLSFNWWIFEKTGSEIQLSIAVMLTFLPMFVFGLFSGIVIDIFNRKSLLVTAAIVRSFFILLVPFFNLFSYLSIWHLYLIAFLQGTASTFFLITRGAIIPQLVSRENLFSANSLVDTSLWLANIIGYFTGAVIIGKFEPMNILLVVVFLLALVSVFCLLLQPITEDIGVIRNKSMSQVFNSLLTGFKIIKDNRIVSILIFTWMGIQILFAIGPMTIGWPAFSKKILNAGPQGYGFLIVAVSISSFFGSLIIGQWGKRIDKGKLMILGFFWGSIGMLWFSLTTDLVMALIVAFLWNSCYPMINIPYMTIIQEHVPPEEIGKVLGFAQTLAAALYPISIVLTGFIMENISLILPFQLFAFALGFCGLVLLFNRQSTINFS
ncbi:MAG: MFS transporter [Promethearchaeota archaeon]